MLQDLYRHLRIGAPLREGLDDFFDGRSSIEEGDQSAQGFHGLAIVQFDTPEFIGPATKSVTGKNGSRDQG